MTTAERGTDAPRAAPDGGSDTLVFTSGTATMPSTMQARIEPEACRATGTDAAALESVVEVFSSMLANGTHPGAQLTVRRAGLLLLQAAGGRTRPGENAPEVTQQTMFLIFSATKPLTALAIHMLAERGKLDLAAPVARYWPEFAQGGKESATSCTC